MVLSLKQKIGLGITVVIAALAIAWGVHYQKQKATALPLLSELIEQTEVDRHELVDLYKKRTDYLLSWEKAVKTAQGKVPAKLVVPDPIKIASAADPKTESEFDHLDLMQNQVSEYLSIYFQAPEAAKVRPAGLEKLEEEINRKRHHYHERAFQANELIQKFDSSHPKVPVFSAEKSLVKAGLWK
jgi:hypothetical protein